MKASKFFLFLLKIIQKFLCESLSFVLLQATIFSEVGRQLAISITWSRQQPDRMADDTRQGHVSSY